MQRRGYRFILLGSALACSLSSSLTAGTADGAPNIHLATVGHINVADFSTCGFVAFGSDMIMTAAHCVIEPNQSEPVDPERISVTVRAQGFAEQVLGVLDVATDPAFSYTGDPTRATVGRDVALLRLDGEIIAGFEAVVAAPVDLTYVGLLPIEEKETTFTPEACAARAESGNVLVLDCKRIPGTPGSPIFAMVDGKRSVIGVISAGGTRSDGSDITFGTNAVPNFSQLSWLKKDRGAVGKF